MSPAGKFDQEIEAKVAELTALLFWQHGAIEVNLEEPFRLTSGALTPIYINCRLLISYPATRDILMSLCKGLYEQRGLSCECVAGGETAGMPFGGWLADRLNKPFVYVRKKAKAHGVKSRLEGVPRGQVLLVEDMVTDGGSKVGFIEGIREADCSVTDCLILVDREQKGDENLAKLGVRLHTLTALSDCLRVGLESGLITSQALEEVNRYLAAPEKWSQLRQS